ncbi:MAG: bifunctional folylpolyglutamate synthase/dihydrofolate synthase [Oleibacter sp.]|nr:bifunctional folylpolyglutamate synthase/dihydrofolate synthase [Thalassolituus sp.]
MVDSHTSDSKSDHLAQIQHWNVSQWLQHLEAIHPSEIDMGLARVQAVAERLGCIKPAARVILVGGTNGKGTTSALLASLLQAHNLNVGVYNSPHIHLYNERVSVNAQHISDDDLCQSFCAVEKARGSDSLTYFEFGTLAALWHFQQLSDADKLDAVVLEIGLGGRLDAVNIVDADLSIVTSIGLDHQVWLGDTLEDIAYEKCSIARAHKPLICGQLNPPASAYETAKTLKGEWQVAGDDFGIINDEDGPIAFSRDERSEYRLPLGDCHIPLPNVATALHALTVMDLRLSDEILLTRIASLRVRGRMQRFQNTHGPQQLILDVAHNPQAAEYLASKLPKIHTLILAMLSDKDVAGVLRALPQCERLMVCGLAGPRGLNTESLALRCQQALSDVNGTVKKYNELLQCKTVSDALALLSEECLSEESLKEKCNDMSSPKIHLVAGSFYTVEAALNWLQCQEDTWNSI